MTRLVCLDLGLTRIEFMIGIVCLSSQSTRFALLPGLDGLPIRDSDRHMECGHNPTGAPARSLAVPHHRLARSPLAAVSVCIRSSTLAALQSRAILFGILQSGPIAQGDVAHCAPRVLLKGGGGRV